MKTPIAPLILRLALSLSGLALFGGNAGAQQYPSCQQDHPNGSRRAESLTKAGDAKMAHKAAGHSVVYAVHRYGLQDYFGDEEINAAADEMYNFLKWKLGSPFLVASQWLTAGYQHFDKAYVDEAAAILLGVIDFEHVEPELKIPPFMQDWLQTQVGKSSEAVTAALVAEGVPPLVAQHLGKLAEQALQGLYDRNKVGVFMPKSYDVDNRLVETAVLAKRGTSWRGKFGGGGGTSLPDRGGPSGGPANGPAAETFPRNGDGPSTATLEARVAQLEARVAELERRLGAVIAPGGPAGDEVPGRGYEAVTLKFLTNSKEAEINVAVNDLLVGVYTQNSTLDLTPYLTSGRMNKISYVGAPPSDGWSQVTIVAKLPGVKDAMKVYDVRLSEERRSDGIEVPIL